MSHTATAPLVCALLVFGCHGPGAGPPAAQQEPFEVVLGRGASWSPGQQGYDPGLPGYHIDGEIASISLRPRTFSTPERLVLAIRTSPGMPPMLENFTLATSDVTLTSAMNLKRVEVKHLGHDPSEPRSSIMTDNTYFRFEVVDDRVCVTLLPDAMRLLTDGCRISWVDWYR